MYLKLYQLLGGEDDHYRFGTLFVVCVSICCFNKIPITTKKPCKWFSNSALFPIVILKQNALTFWQQMSDVVDTNQIVFYDLTELTPHTLFEIACPLHSFWGCTYPIVTMTCINNLQILCFSQLFFWTKSRNCLAAIGDVVDAD